ncbi:hypothetical protein [Pandoraea sp. B-6]|uniref:hypothetical protein n=1 Tax=Pandoraea sp. B-6 TaxID=1204340 RepID=UPI00037691AA|nr:hypothetical protein [Pandoraea sp. B-6]
MADFVITTVSSAALVSVTGYAFRDWITAKIKGAIEHEYNARLESVKAENSGKLEELKAQLAQQASMLTLAHKSLSDYAQPFHQRRLDALSGLWEAFLLASSITPAVVSARWDILEPSEYAEGIRRGTLFELTDKTVTDAISRTEHAENYRPFVGESIWAFFFSYRALLGRISFLYSQGFKHKNLKPWFEDGSVLFLLKNLFSENELTQLVGHRVGKFNAIRQATHAKFARMIMAAASARAETEEHLKKAHELVLAVSQIQVDQDRGASATGGAPKPDD